MMIAVAIYTHLSRQLELDWSRGAGSLIAKMMKLPGNRGVDGWTSWCRGWCKRCVLDGGWRISDQTHENLNYLYGIEGSWR